MNPRIVLLGIGIAVGYVLGTRDGRERYDAMKARVVGVWEDPRVAKARADVDAFARTQGPIIRERAEAAAKAAPGVVADVAKDVGGKVSTTAKDVASKVSVVAGDMREQAERVSADLRERGEKVVNKAAATAGQAREDFMDLPEDDDEPKP